MYTYKIKVSIREDAKNYDDLRNQLNAIIKRAMLIPLGNNEYGTDNFASGMGMIQALGRKEWILDNAQELVWYNGEEYDETGKYYVEDSLKYFTDKRIRGDG